MSVRVVHCARILLFSYGNLPQIAIKNFRKKYGRQYECERAMHDPDTPPLMLRLSHIALVFTSRRNLTVLPNKVYHKNIRKIVLSL